ncbi:hypothetical protein [Gemmata massiliana]|nr:hypothetical protein [Gemmata massiliana]
MREAQLSKEPPTPPRKKKPLPLPEDAPGQPLASHESPLARETAPPAGDTARTRAWQPDPFPLMTITLGFAKDSPRMTLFRSNKFNQMAVGRGVPGGSHDHAPTRYPATDRRLTATE